MSKIKKFAAATLVALMTLTTAACGGGSEGSNSTSNTNSANNERTEIVYYHINPDNSGVQMINEYAEAFNESQDQYTVKPIFVNDSYKGIMQQLQADSAAGNPPAVVQVGYYWLNFFTESYPFADIRDIDDAYLDNYLPNVIDISTASDGRVAGIPYSLSTPVMYYNIDLLEEAGLDTANLPTTVDEMYDWARTVKSETSKYGLALAAATDFWLEQWEIESNGGRMMETTDGQPKATFASDEGIKALQGIADLINQDKAAVYITGSQVKDAFTSGEVAMMGATIGWSSSIANDVAFDLQTDALPTYGDKTPRVPVGGNFLALTGDTDAKKEGGWEWIKFLTTQEGYTDWTVATGYVPPRGDVEDTDAFKQVLETQPLLNASLKQMPNTVPFNSFPGKNGLEIEQKLLDARDVIMNGEATAEETLKQLQEETNTLLS